MTADIILFQTWRLASPTASRWHQSNVLSTSRTRRRKKSTPWATPKPLRARTIPTTRHTATACMEPLQKIDDVTSQIVKDAEARRAALSEKIADQESVVRTSSALTLRKRERLRIRAKRPVWTYILIAMNCGVVIAQKLTLVVFRVFALQSLPPNFQVAGAKMSTKMLSGELWRLLTPAFLHVNIRHLLLNMYALYALGSATEILYGSPAFLSIYIGGAVGGNMASLCANLSSTRASVGSSGAVFGLIAAMCVHLHRNRGAIGPIAHENLRMVGTATVVNLMGGWLMPSVDGWAHFGGWIYGSLLAAYLAPTVVLHRSSDTGRVTFVEVRRAGRRASVVVCSLAVGVSIVVAVALGVFCGGCGGYTNVLKCATSFL